MIIDSVEIFELKGAYYTLTMTDWFLQTLPVIPRGSWADVARRFIMVRWLPFASLSPSSRRLAPTVVSHRRRRWKSFRTSRCGDSVRKNFTGFLVQTGEGIEFLVVDRIRPSHRDSTVEGHLPSGLIGAGRLVVEGFIGKFTCFTIKLYNNDTMETIGKKKIYRGGSVEFIDHVDMDMISLIELWGYAKEVGYNGKEKFRFWHKIGKTLNDGRYLDSDEIVLDMNHIPRNFEVEIYMEHVDVIQTNDSNGLENAKELDVVISGSQSEDGTGSKNDEDSDGFYESEFEFEEGDKLFDNFVDASIQNSEKEKLGTHGDISNELLPIMQRGDDDCANSDCMGSVSDSEVDDSKIFPTYIRSYVLVFGETLFLALVVNLSMLLPESSGFLAVLVVAQYKLLVLASAGLETFGVDWFCRWTIIEVIPVVASAIYRKTWSSNSIPDSILSKYFQPFVPYLSNPRALFSRELSGDFPSFRILPESSGFLAVLIVAQYKETQVLQLVVGLTQLVVPQEVASVFQ
ncbi:hypothetical protein F511_41939 [Dorcoceras hygrometricum]|uniref:PB1-like domain-containing protein n=1 Tax=Dorcoceras hygrometricum TaxID=472368 RepID=A0A2Z7CUG7_9LAMI|nr:hypothetical protein F511_41939 [Dorcoceras hygrometricum]